MSGHVADVLSVRVFWFAKQTAPWVRADSATATGRLTSMVAYSDISYASCSSELLRLARERPDLASLSTTQALYGLPTAGECGDASGNRAPCQNFILEITNRTSLAADRDRPEILISGALHGDERIGPSTALALSRWLVERYDSDD